MSEINFHLAAISASISVLALMWTVGWSVWLYKQTQKPRVKVVLFPAMTINLPPVWIIYATVVNTGFVPITIQNVVLQVGGERATLLPREWMGAGTFPKLLKGGECISTAPAVYAELYAKLRDTFPKCQDANETWTVVAIANEASGEKVASLTAKIGDPSRFPFPEIA